MHNLCGQEGVEPGRLLARSRQDVARYGVDVIPGEVVEAHRADLGWVVRLHACEELHTRAIVLATGVVEDLPPVDGLAALWGGDVVSCPYCHGWEARGQGQFAGRRSGAESGGGMWPLPRPGTGVDLKARIRCHLAADETAPQPVERAPGSDGLVENRRAPRSGTAAHATT